jgi:DNA polymerase-3 subunit gamma/tau
MSQVLYRKWRPQTWESVIGQDHIIQTLRNALLAGRTSHAYLFAGPRGTGKTTTARLLAKAVNCLEPELEGRPCGKCEHCTAVNEGRFLDLIEIDAASNTSVEDVRSLREKINFSPNQGEYKVYIIDEVHMLSTAAFNALLKTLEEPPPHAIFVLATTEVHKIPATVLSRCQRHEFRRIPVVEIVKSLEMIAEGEDIQITPEALTLVARQSTGSMRDAISLLDQLSSGDETITLEMAHTVLGTAVNQSVIEVVEALVMRQPAEGLDHIHRTLDGGSDPRQFARQIVDYLRDLLLIRMQNADQVDATAEVRAQMAKHAQAFETLELLSVIRAFNHAATSARGVWQPALPLEMAFVDSLQAAPVAEETSPMGTPAPASASRPAPKPKPASVREGSPAPQKRVAEADPEDRQATQSLSQAWPRILNLVRDINPRAYGLLNSAKSRYIRGNDLVLDFASDILKTQMEKDDNLEDVHKAITQALKRELGIICRVDTAKRDEIPADVEDDGMVASALRDLGGEIVDIQ